MKLTLLTLLILGTTWTFAIDSITGKILLNKKVLNITIETNINIAKNVNLDGENYRINRINTSNIGASNATTELEIFIGEAMKRIKQMSTDQIVEYFGLENGNEMNCTNNSLGFLVKNEGSSVLGNCIN